MSTIKLGKSNQEIKNLKDLYKKNNSNDLIIIEDLNSLNIALSNNLTITKFFFVDDIKYHEDTKRIIEEASKKALETFSFSNAVFQGLSLKSNSIGFIAIVRVETIKLQDLKDKSFIVVCDKLETPGNLGTIYRTMDSAACDAMILVDPITKFNNPSLTLAARGTNLIIPTCISSYEEAVNYLENNGYDIYLGEPLLGKDYQNYDYSGKIAIVVGNERFGINSDWYNHKSKNVFIPMEGHNNSLNVSVAASILIYEAYMKKKVN